VARSEARVESEILAQTPRVRRELTMGGRAPSVLPRSACRAVTSPSSAVRIFPRRWI